VSMLFYTETAKALNLTLMVERTDAALPCVDAAHLKRWPSKSRHR